MVQDKKVRFNINIFKFKRAIKLLQIYNIFLNIITVVF